MKLIIDTRNGISGDIIIAGLLGLGADPDRILPSLDYAAGLIGGASIRHHVDSGVSRIFIESEGHHRHLHEPDAFDHLADIIRHFRISEKYADVARKSLDTLCRAERHVHAHHPGLAHMKHHGEGAVLHEASDILIDITGLALGLADLEIKGVHFIEKVFVGSGKIRFSHGEFDVPAPATRHILDAHNIPWARSEIKGEMATPTGATILVGCGATGMESIDGLNVARKTLAGGTRALPPVPFYLTE